ncbi:MAG: PIN domain-containing protein [Candidatus Helarchaeota archaeon]
MRIGTKFIIDTNIIFSALYAPESNAGKVIERAIENKIELYAPESVKEELRRNLRNKLAMDKDEIDLTIRALPIKWLDEELYSNFINKALKRISSKDASILAAHYLTRFPIITGDKEFWELEGIQVLTLKNIIDELEN